MSEYIPTTDEVQGRYVHSRIYLVDFPEKKARKEFDRWLTQIKAEVWDEGFNAGIDHAIFNEFVFNPYSIKSERAQQYIQGKLRDDKRRLTKAKARE